MAIQDLASVSNMLMGDYNNSLPVQNYVSAASTGINNQTNKAIRDLWSRFATTGMSRSGIGGAAANQIYSGAGQNLSNVAAQGEVMQQQARENDINKLLGIAQYEDSKPTFGDYIGSILGQVGGTALGALTGGLSTGLTGGLSSLLGGGSNSFGGGFGMNMSIPNVSASNYFGINPQIGMG